MSSKKKQQKGPGCLSYIIVIMIIYALISSFVDTYHSEILKFIWTVDENRQITH